MKAESIPVLLFFIVASLFFGAYELGGRIHTDKVGIITNISSNDKDYCNIEVESGMSQWRYRNVIAKCNKYSVGDSVYLTLIKK